MVNTRRYEISSEVLNAVSHGLAFFTCIIGLVFLIDKGLSTSNLALFAYMVYGISLILLFLASTLLHSFVFTKAKKAFMICDHSAIYILIAGTYTPYLLLSIGGVLGWTVFVVIWLIAIVGIIMKVFFLSKYNRVFKASTLLYVLMGWLSMLIVVPVYNSIDFNGFVLLMLGGLFYTVGAFIYSRSFKYNHVIWHCFVILGALCMYLSIYLYV